MNKTKKIKKITYAMLILTIAFISLSLFSSLFIKKDVTKINAAEPEADIQELYIGNPDPNGKVFDKEALQALYRALGSNSGTLSGLNSRAIAQNITVGTQVYGTTYESDPIVVTLGGQKWYAMFLTTNDNSSNSNRITGDNHIILTLWLAYTDEKVQWNKVADWSASSSYNYPSNMYGTSYIRSLLVGSDYLSENDYTFSKLTEGEQQEKWKVYTEENQANSLSNYLVAPSDVAYQTTSSINGVNFAGLGSGNCFYYPNELAINNYGGQNNGWGYKADGSSGPNLGDNTRNFDMYAVAQNDHYLDWSNDKIWIPSMIEAGVADYYTARKIWQSSRTQLTMNDTTNNDSEDDAYQITWYRTGDQAIVTTMHAVNGAGNWMYVDGQESTGQPGFATKTGYLRPALHLDLTAADAASATVIDAPEEIDATTAHITKVYDGKSSEIDIEQTKNYPDIIEATLGSDNPAGSSFENATNKFISGKDVGTYTLELGIKSDAQTDYIWSDGKTSPTAKLTYTIEIKKREVDVSVQGSGEYGSEHRPEVIFSNASAEDDLNDTVTNELVEGTYTLSWSEIDSLTNSTVIGNYKAQVTLNSDVAKNFEIKNNNNDNYEVTPLYLPVPTVNELTYNGVLQTGIISDFASKELNSIGVDSWEDLCTITNDGGEKAATGYQVIMTLKNPYVNNVQWDTRSGTGSTSGDSGETLTILYNIVRRHITINVTGESQYTGESIVPQLDTNITFADVDGQQEWRASQSVVELIKANHVISYRNKNAVAVSSLLNAGEYQVIISLTGECADNFIVDRDGIDYDGIFKITQADNKWNQRYSRTPLDGRSDGGWERKHSATITEEVLPTCDFGSPKIEYFKVEETDIPFVGLFSTSTEEGHYKVVITVAETENYKGLNDVYEFDIVEPIHQYNHTDGVASSTRDGKHIETCTVPGCDQTEEFDCTYEEWAYSGQSHWTQCHECDYYQVTSDHDWIVDPEYNETMGYSWGATDPENHTKVATLHLVCKTCGEKGHEIKTERQITVNGIESPATCTSQQTYTYTATINITVTTNSLDDDGGIQTKSEQTPYTNTVTENGDPALGHNWIIDPEYQATNGFTWEEDKPTIHFSCSRCPEKYSYDEEKDPSFVSTPSHVEATCDENEYTEYSVSIEKDSLIKKYDNDAFDESVLEELSSSNKVEVPNTYLGHKWVPNELYPGGWNFTDMGDGSLRATLNYICADKKCSATCEIEVSDVTKNTQRESCLLYGYTEYSVEGFDLAEYVLGEIRKGNPSFTDHDAFFNENGYDPDAEDVHKNVIVDFNEGHVDHQEKLTASKQIIDNPASGHSYSIDTNYGNGTGWTWDDNGGTIHLLCGRPGCSVEHTILIPFSKMTKDDFEQTCDTGSYTKYTIEFTKEFEKTKEDKQTYLNGIDELIEAGVIPASRKDEYTNVVDSFENVYLVEQKSATYETEQQDNALGHKWELDTAKGNKLQLFGKAEQDFDSSFGDKYKGWSFKEISDGVFQVTVYLKCTKMVKDDGEGTVHYVELTGIAVSRPVAGSCTTPGNDMLYSITLQADDNSTYSNEYTLEGTEGEVSGHRWKVDDTYNEELEGVGTFEKGYLWIPNNDTYLETDLSYIKSYTLYIRLVCAAETEDASAVIIKVEVTGKVTPANCLENYKVSYNKHK